MINLNSSGSFSDFLILAVFLSKFITNWQSAEWVAACSRGNNKSINKIRKWQVKKGASLKRPRRLIGREDFGILEKKYIT